MVTVAALTELTAAGLRRAGLEDARREALRLIADLGNCTPGDLLLRGEREASPEWVDRVESAARRRAGGEPLAYASGWAGFRNLVLAVDRRVLIPRPETEGLVDLVIKSAPRGRALDVGTGSGCIALSLAQEGQYEEVVAVDKSADALAVAGANAARLGLPVTLLEGDLFEPVSGQEFQVIVSNPPYLTQGELETLDPSVRDWEPQVALVSGVDGLDAIRGLLTGAHDILAPGGLLALELDSSRAAVVAALAHRAGWGDVAVIQDLYGRDRYLTARREPIR